MNFKQWTKTFYVSNWQLIVCKYFHHLCEIYSILRF